MLGRRAVHAQHAVRHRLQPAAGDWLATSITHTVGPPIELGQRPLGALKPTLQRVANADVGQPANRLRRAIADAFTEPNRAAALGSLCEYGQTLARAITPRLQFLTDLVRVQIARWHGHTYVLLQSGTGRQECGPDIRRDSADVRPLRSDLDPLCGGPYPGLSFDDPCGRMGGVTCARVKVADPLLCVLTTRWPA